MLPAVLCHSHRRRLLVGEMAGTAAAVAAGVPKRMEGLVAFRNEVPSVKTAGQFCLGGGETKVKVNVTGGGPDVRCPPGEGCKRRKIRARDVERKRCKRRCRVVVRTYFQA